MKPFVITPPVWNSIRQVTHDSFALEISPVVFRTDPLKTTYAHTLFIGHFYLNLTAYELGQLLGGN